MSGISTHVLDLANGTPGVGIDITLERAGGAGWNHISAATTDADGRVKALIPSGGTLAPGNYKLRFDTAPYFTRNGTAAFFPVIEIVFVVSDPSRNHHVPLLLSPFGYSTYRGT